MRYKTLSLHSLSPSHPHSTHSLLPRSVLQFSCLCVYQYFAHTETDPHHLQTPCAIVSHYTQLSPIHHSLVDHATRAKILYRDSVSILVADLIYHLLFGKLVLLLDLTLERDVVLSLRAQRSPHPSQHKDVGVESQIRVLRKDLIFTICQDKVRRDNIAIHDQSVMYRLWRQWIEVDRSCTSLSSGSLLQPSLSGTFTCTCADAIQRDVVRITHCLCLYFCYLEQSLLR